MGLRLGHPDRTRGHAPRAPTPATMKKARCGSVLRGGLGSRVGLVYIESVSRQSTRAFFTRLVFLRLGVVVVVRVVPAYLLCMIETKVETTAADVKTGRPVPSRQWAAEARAQS